jgi:hypothetical protein
MDTICVPVGEKNKPYRKKAIAQMAEIYHCSVSVLVLNVWLQGLSIRSSIPDKVARIYVSNWLHRLWTVQESSMGDNLYIQFSDSAQSIDHIMEQCRTYGEGAKKPKDWAVYIRSPERIEEASISYITALRGFSRPGDAQASREARSLQLAHLSRAFAQRATSKMEDEAICASTLLSLDTAALLGIDDKDRNVVAEKRIEEFWKQLRGVSKGFVFHHSPRLRKRGFRWAPQTLMGGRSGDFWRDFDKGVSEFEGPGLSVPYPGIVIDGAMMPPPKRTLTVQLRSEPSTYYSIELFPDKDGYPEWRTHSRCAVIMFRSIFAGSAWTDAILGIREDDDHDRYNEGYKIPLLFQARARVKAWTRDEKTDFSVAGRLLGATQEWLVL